MAVGGYATDDPDDPLWVVAPSVVDLQVTQRRLDKERREDIQLWGFLLAVAISTEGAAHPLTVGPGGNPPDRVVSSSARRWGCELTELTIGDVRAELARVRRFGRALRARLEDDASRFGHLVGRSISASHVELPDSTGQAALSIEESLEPVLAALVIDKGFVGEGLDLSAGPPAHLGDRGFYGQHGAFVVVVNGVGAPGTFTVAAGAGVQIRRSEALTLLRERVAAKDIKGTDALLITCGLPDELGYLCPLDEWLFQHLWSEIVEGRPLLDAAPSHLRAVALHQWRTGAWIHAFGDQSSSPWAA